MYVESYLFFSGRCEEAVEFYKRAIGAKDVELLRFKDAPEKPPPGAVPAGFEDKIMHGIFTVGDTKIMVSDGHSAESPGFHGFGLVLNSKSEAETSKLFGALSEGGEVRMPLAKTFFSPCFGMVVDKFGVLWMTITEA
jgi:PhnB protein